MHLLPSLSLLSTLVLSLSLCDVALADSHGARSIGGGSLRHRHAFTSTNLTERDNQLEKRFSDCRFTYYADGLGACGNTNSPGDYVSGLRGLIVIPVLLKVVFNFLDRCAELRGMLLGVI